MFPFGNVGMIKVNAARTTTETGNKTLEITGVK